MAFLFFTSYARLDNREGRLTTAVNRLRDRLIAKTGENVEIFFDTQELKNGVEWQERLGAALKDTRVIVCLCSPAYLKSAFCAKEFEIFRLRVEAAAGHDVAIIPIDLTDAFARGKPENKLVMLWQLGMPVLTSDTPAYRRAMDSAGLDLTCADSTDWRAKLGRMIEASDEERERIARQGRAFAERAYSKDEFLKRFDRAFELAGFEF